MFKSFLASISVVDRSAKKTFLEYLILNIKFSYRYLQKKKDLFLFVFTFVLDKKSLTEYNIEVLEVLSKVRKKEQKN